MADQTMDTPVRSLDSSPGRALALTFALAAIVGALAPRPADAQIVRVGASNPLVGMTIRGNAAGYDPIHGAYLMVGGNSVVQGVCVNASGMPVSGVITIMGNGGLFGSFPRVKFSPNSPDGAGGAGAFLVSWVQTDAPGATAVHARLVSCAPSVLNTITPDVLVSDYQQGGAYYDVGGSAIAYSRTSHRFLIVFKTLFAGLQARFVDAGGNPIGGVIPLANPGGAQYPGVAWNPATDEFGISYSGYNGSVACGNAPFVGFVRLRARRRLSVPAHHIWLRGGDLLHGRRGQHEYGPLRDGLVAGRRHPLPGVRRRRKRDRQHRHDVGRVRRQRQLQPRLQSGERHVPRRRPACPVVRDCGCRSEHERVPDWRRRSAHIGRRGAGLVPSGGHGPERRAAVGHLLRASVQHADRSDHRDGFNRRRTVRSRSGASTDADTRASAHGRLHDGEPVRELRDGRVREWRMAVRGASGGTRAGTSTATCASAGAGSNWLQHAQPVRGLRHGRLCEWRMAILGAGGGAGTCPGACTSQHRRQPRHQQPPAARRRTRLRASGWACV